MAKREEEVIAYLTEKYGDDIQVAVFIFREQNEFMSGELMTNFCCRAHMTQEVVGLLGIIASESPAASVPKHEKGKMN